MQKVAIIGMGEIGTAIYDDINKTNKVQIHGVDINPAIVEQLGKKGYSIGNIAPKSDVYIICVYTTEQVLNTVKKIKQDNKPLISIESTVHPESIKELVQLSYLQKFDLVVFPHRYNPNDSQHRIFNLKRVLGADNTAARARALEFYKQFMPQELLTCVPLETAALSKIVENAYRFFEISFAQELKRICDQKGLDFELLKQAANTKWNIDIKDARDGIKGKCLPKDTKILADYSGSTLLKTILDLNNKYVDEYTQNLHEKQGK